MFKRYPFSSFSYYLRGLSFVRAMFGLASLLKNTSQVFPQNKFHDDAFAKQDYF